MKTVVIKRMAAVSGLIFFSVICGGVSIADDGAEGKKTEANIWTKDHKIDVAKPGKEKRVRFDGKGIIDQIDPEAKNIVINDQQKTLADKVRYLKEFGGRALERQFKKGVAVGYIFGPDRKIVRLYLIEEEGS